MKVKFILPALTEAKSPFWRPIKYSLFPPLGLATLAAYLGPDDEAELVDDHVEQICTDDAPDLVVIQVYITNAYRAYAMADHYRARGCFVALGGLHVTSLPEEAAPHADAIFLGPANRRFQNFWKISRRQAAAASTSPRRAHDRRLAEYPARSHQAQRYLVPNSIVVTRGCPQHCDFCYKDAFFRRWTRVLHAARRRCPGRDRPPARTASLFPRRSSARRPPFCRSAVCRHDGHGTAFSGRGNGGFRVTRRSDRARGGGGLAQSFLSASRPSARRTFAQQQEAESRPRLQGSCATD